MKHEQNVFQNLSSWWPYKDKDGRFWTFVRTRNSITKFGPYTTEQAAVTAVEVALEKALKDNINILAEVE